MAYRSLTTEKLPFDYTLRRSRRAKSFLLKVSREAGVELVYPWYASKNDALNFLYSRLDWLEKQRAYMPSNTFLPPTDINLPSLDRAIMIRYTFDERRKSSRLSAKDSFELVYSGPDDFDRIADVLLRWVHAEALTAFKARLQYWVNLTGLQYSGVQLRRQKTLWGSCNADRRISLNGKLAFLPKELSDYVLLHELCHTRYMDHSKAFWSLLALYMPDYKDKERMLKTAEKYVPDWYLQA